MALEYGMDDGYPSDFVLRKIKEWPYNDYENLVKFIGRVWHDGSGFLLSRNKLFLNIGGWPGNECVIRALKENVLFWSLCWVCSSKGGNFVFDLSKVLNCNVGALRVYLAGLDALQENESDNHRKIECCREMGFEVFCENGKGDVSSSHVSNLNCMSLEMLEEADILVVNVSPQLDGCVDHKALFYMGVAIGKGKQVYAYSNRSIDDMGIYSMLVETGDGISFFMVQDVDDRSAWKAFEGVIQRLKISYLSKRVIY